MALAHAWTHEAVGRLAPVEQAKLWALREVLRKQGEEDTQYQWMSTKVKLVGGVHPEREAVRQFFQRVNKDANWHPGKSAGTMFHKGCFERTGPDPEPSPATL